ncbi:MAG: phage tail tape measure protein, partial [Pyrinomonadaceae bacterium]
MAVDYDLGTARGRIEIDSAQLGRASQALTVVGQQMIGLGVLAGAGFVVAVKSAADFEHQMSAVAAVLQGETRPQFAALKELALDLGSTTVFSAGEIAGAMEALSKAGIPVEDMLNGAVEATVALAAAAGDELPGGVERAAEVIANAQKTFNASADELNHFANVLVGAAASSTLSVEDLATSFRYAGPIAAQLGLSIDDLNTVLAILGDRGIKGSTAGTSLRGVLLSLTPSSEKAANTMRDLGL